LQNEATAVTSQSRTVVKSDDVKFVKRPGTTTRAVYNQQLQVR